MNTDAFETVFEPLSTENGWVQYDEPPTGVPVSCIWTVVEGDNDTLHLLNGVHRVNRIYHIVTRFPHDPEVTYVIGL